MWPALDLTWPPVFDGRLRARRFGTVAIGRCYISGVTKDSCMPSPHQPTEMMHDLAFSFRSGHLGPAWLGMVATEVSYTRGRLCIRDQ